jgi:hypothetical protein
MLYTLIKAKSRSRGGNMASHSEAAAAGTKNLAQMAASSCVVARRLEEDSIYARKTPSYERNDYRGYGVWCGVVWCGETIDEGMVKCFLGFQGSGKCIFNSSLVITTL